MKRKTDVTGDAQHPFPGQVGHPSVRFPTVRPAHAAPHAGDDQTLGPPILGEWPTCPVEEGKAAQREMKQKRRKQAFHELPSGTSLRSLPGNPISQVNRSLPIPSHRIQTPHLSPGLIVTHLIESHPIPPSTPNHVQTPSPPRRTYPGG